MKLKMLISLLDTIRERHGDVDVVLSVGFHEHNYASNMIGHLLFVGCDDANPTVILRGNEDPR